MDKCVGLFEFLLTEQIKYFYSSRIICSIYFIFLWQLKSVSIPKSAVVQILFVPSLKHLNTLVHGKKRTFS